jgi:O-acetyl-ADP-ribose deacetylase (regulator of RNase III)
MIEFTSGDLLRGREAYIAQGVAEGNQEGLGTGLALKISRRWPDVQSAFKRHARSGRFRGGDLWVCEPAPGRPGVVYLATQPDMYHATLSYLRKALRRLARWSDDAAVRSVGLPKIGGGLGKLSWPDEVRPLVIEHLATPSCRFVVYEDFTHDDETE